MYIERVPKDSTSLVTAVSTPAMIEAINMTVTTPMITPITVRNDRNLFARKVFSAIQRFSRMSVRRMFICQSGRHTGTSYFRSQGFDRIESRRFPRRKYSRENSKSARDYQRQGDCSEREIRLKNKDGHYLPHDPGQKDPDRPSDCGHGGRFQQELLKDVVPARAPRLPDPNLLGTFRHR